MRLIHTIKCSCSALHLIEPQYSYRVKIIQLINPFYFYFWWLFELYWTLLILCWKHPAPLWLELHLSLYVDLYSIWNELQVTLLWNSRACPLVHVELPGNRLYINPMLADNVSVFQSVSYTPSYLHLGLDSHFVAILVLDILSNLDIPITRKYFLDLTCYIR